jgi:uncharacterized protein YcaQ
VQADPIRSPARAQDLTLRHRVKNYRAGDLERNYTKLGIEEDFFVVYGFVTAAIQALMHPRSDTGVPADSREPWPAARKKRAELLLEFVRERGSAHPREVEALLARQGDELLGRLVECHDTLAGRHALSRLVARGAAR